MRGVPLLAFTKTCAYGQALLLWSTLRQVFDHCPLSNRPPPRTSRLLSCHRAVGCRRGTLPSPWVRYAATIAMDVHANHCGPRGDDVSTNRRSIGALVVD